MKIFPASPIQLLGACLFAVSARADGQAAGDNSYRAIATHNSFASKSAPPAASAVSTPLPEITLNGITTIFGDKRALFKVRPLQSAKEQAYFLSEGERLGDLELLSVDVKAGRVKISNHGIVQMVVLCQTPQLAWQGTGASFAGDAGGMNRRDYPGNLQAGGALAGDGTPGAANGQLYQQGYGGGQGNNSGAPANDGTGSGSQGEDGTGTQNGSPTGETQKSEPYAVRAARDFEQTRIQTADAVRSGVSDPLPLTPLTPPGTPPELVGPGRAWFADD